MNLEKTLPVPTTQEAAFEVLAQFPYRGKVERIQRLRAAFEGLALRPAVGFLDAFLAAGSPMKVEIILDGPQRRSASFPDLPVLAFPDHLARSYHQKELKAAAGHLAKEIMEIDLHTTAPDPMCATPAAGLRAALVVLLRDWSEAL